MNQRLGDWNAFNAEAIGNRESSTGIVAQCGGVLRRSRFRQAVRSTNDYAGHMTVRVTKLDAT
jgi:hypothetical protein